MSTTENEELVSREYTQPLQDREDGRALGALAEEFEQFNGRIINVLAALYRKSKPAA
jgi:hypothetical protein